MATQALNSIQGLAVRNLRLESVMVEERRAISELDDIDELVRRHQARIRRFVTCSIGDADLADTITQDTLLRAHRGRENFRGECSVQTWLTGIAINITRDHLRSARFRFWRQVRTTAVDVHEMASCLPSGAVSPEREMLAKERVGQIYEALKRLSYNQRAAFLMKFQEEMSVEEIGEILGMAPSTVRTHLHRALKAVRAQVGVQQ